MPIGALFDPNMQARGVFPGILLDQLLQEARTSLAGQGGPTPAATLQSQQPGFPVSEGGAGAGSPVGGPTPASAGGRTGLGPGLGLFGGLLGTALGVPFLSLPFAFGRTMDTVANAFRLGDPLASLMASPTRSGGNDPSVGPPGGIEGSGLTAPEAPSPSSFSFGGGPAGPTGPGPGEGGPSSSGSGGEFRRGGTVPGRRGRSKRITAHAGETVVNEVASKRFKPILDAMNALIEPNPTLDDALDRARAFFKD